jgi:hypothetical protein
MSTALDISLRSSKEDVKTVKYELDGIIKDAPTTLGLGSTRHDQMDMRRMGKNQELMIRADLDRAHDLVLTYSSECFVIFRLLVSRS